MSQCDLKVFFDGKCPVCKTEIGHLRKTSGSEKIEFIDFTDSNFNASAENLDPSALTKKMHALTSDGKIVTGVDALIEMYKRVPRYRWLSTLLGTPGLHFIAKIFYSIFAKIRPRLQ